MSTQRFDYLFKKHFEKTATPEEKEELMQLLQQPENQAALEILLDQALAMDQPVQDMDATAAASILASITSVDRTLAPAGEEPPTVAKRRKLPSRKIISVAAAVLIIAFAGIIYFLQPNNPGPSKTVARITGTDKLPGSSKAVLTLSDGSKVTLDSTAYRAFQQEGIEVNQQQDVLQYHGQFTGGAIAYNTLTTPRGGQFRILLPDSTKVWLNAASSLQYPVAFTGNTREVTLTGEAYFEVTKDKSKPFFVRAGGTEVKVLGTAFNIMAYADEQAVQTTLIEGSVQLSHGKRANIKLKPGQQAVSNNSSIHLRENADLEEALAWKKGQFLFNGSDLPVLLRQFARWYDIEVEWKGQPKSYAFTGTMPRTARLSSVLTLLRANDIPYTLEKNKLIVQSK